MQSMKIENKHWGTKGNRSAGSQWAQGMISAGASADASGGNGGRGQSPRCVAVTFAWETLPHPDSRVWQCFSGESHSHTPAVVALEFGVQTHVASTVIMHQLYVF